MQEHKISDIKANSAFARKVYEIVYHIPKGHTMTYNEIAGMIGSSPRAVGQALKRNPNAPWVPCHRVIKSDGTMGGYNGIKGIPQKIDMLKKEGISIKDGRKADNK